MAFAHTRQECKRRRDQFVSRYERNYPKASGKLLRDWERMVTFYSFPKEHWTHLRTSNIAESPFATIRLRIPQSGTARRYKRVDNATAMIWKLLQVAERAWRRLKGHELLEDVYHGKRYVDGMPVKDKSDPVECAA